MSRAKIICKLLFYVCRIAAVAYLGAVCYAAFCLVTGWGITPYGEGQYLHINYPFTEQPFLNVDNNVPYIVFSFLMPLTLYGIFFLLASNVFRVFYQPRLFTIPNLKQLKLFYLLNLVVPVIAAVLAEFFVPVEGGIWILVAVHCMLGIFIYLLAVIFRQGLKLQNEQDLFI